MEPPALSVVIPLYNEEENVDALVDELLEVLPQLGTFEVLAIDDGSRDRTRERLLRRVPDMPQLRVLRLKQNKGQSTAICCGFDHARAPVVLMMDGDMQNDAHDFPRLLEALAGADGVSGIRARRRDGFVRRLSSRVANGIRNWISGDRVVDSASGIKAFKRDLLDAIPRFHGMHRFLPTLVRMAGGRVVEIPVNHRPRAGGKAKYGVLNRAFRAFVDLCGVRWIKSRWVDYELAEDVDAIPAAAGRKRLRGPAA